MKRLRLVRSPTMRNTLQWGGNVSSKFCMQADERKIAYNHREKLLREAK